MTKKQIALDFIHLCAAGTAHVAFPRYAAPHFKHHNAWFPGDATTLMEAMDESARQNPDKVFDVQRVLEDGDLVAIHSRVRQNPGDPDYVVMHLFRFEGDLIAELWDFGQEVPKDCINENGMF